MSEITSLLGTVVREKDIIKTGEHDQWIMYPVRYDVDFEKADSIEIRDRFPYYFRNESYQVQLEPLNDSSNEHRYEIVSIRRINTLEDVRIYGKWHHV